MKDHHGIFIRLLLVPVLLVSVLAVTGCIFDTDPEKDPGKYQEPTSPAIVIENLNQSYVLRDIDQYKKCLSPYYTFYFNPTDVGTDVNGYTIPTSWGYNVDWEATNNMFDNAYTIDMQISITDIGTPEPGATEYVTGDVGIYLLVMVDAGNGYLANNGSIKFKFETYDSDGNTYWRIKDWWDFTYA